MNVENATFTFLVSWGVWLVLLSGFNKFRLGHVLLYYSLLLMILFVLVSQYAQLMPYLTGIRTPSQIGVTAISDSVPAVVPAQPTSHISTTVQPGTLDPDGDGSKIFPAS